MKLQRNKQLMGSNTAPGYGNPEDDIRMEWHRIDGTLPVPMHWHTYCEFEFVETGEGVHTFNNVKLPLQKGSAYLCMTDDFHKIENNEGSALSIINIKFSATLIAPELLKAINGNDFQHYCTVKEDQLIPFSHMVAFLKQIISDSSPVVGADPVLKSELIHSTLNQILALFLALCKKENAEHPNSMNEHSEIQKAITYIHHHFCEDISENSVAARCGLTTQYFSNLFKEEVHCNYSTYLLKLRLNYARNLIETHGVKNVKELTEIIGFSSASYFIRRFRERFGITPKEMMTQNKEQNGFNG